jgi:hypothetical protein
MAMTVDCCSSIAAANSAAFPGIEDLAGIEQAHRHHRVGRDRANIGGDALARRVARVGRREQAVE